MEFSKNLKWYRKDKHMSQVNLAKAIGVKQGTIANYETGNRTPTIELLLKLSRYLSVSVDDLLGADKINEKKNSSSDYSKINKRIVDFLIHKEEYKVFKEIEDVYRDKKDMVDIFEFIITPVMYNIGYLWQDGKISIADEHFGVEVMTRMVDWISVVGIENHEKSKKAISMSVSSELHTLGIRMISAVMELEGYRAVFIGNNLPTNELINLLTKEKPDVFMISVTLCSHFDSLMNVVMLIREVPELAHIAIIIGGQGIQEDKLGSINNVYPIRNIKLLQKWLDSKNE